MAMITQETFDEAVQENINDLGLSPEEAVTEAINQFTSQGVNLSNILTTKSLINSDNICKAITNLKTFNSDNSSQDDYLNELNSLKQECDKSLDYRVIAGKEGAYDVILNIFLKFEGMKEIQLACVKTLLSLMTKQPDLLEQRGIEAILTYLDTDIDKDIQKFILKWIKECCIMHEMNRQNLIDSQILMKLVDLLRQNDYPNLKEILGIFRALILDDDVRAEIGRGPEHAKLISQAVLPDLIEFLSKYKSDEQILGDLLLTVAALLVRTEYCKKVEEANGIEILNDIMTTHATNEKIIRHSFKLLKALSGNDETKANIFKNGLAPVIVNSISSHKTNAQTVTASLGCIAAFALRSPENSKIMFEAGIPEVIVEVMKLHPNEKALQRTASWAIRNMVSRSRYQNEHFLELGVEELLRNNLSKFKEFEYDTKSALRDLDCNVNFKEEWTGKGGKLTTDLKLQCED